MFMAIPVLYSVSGGVSVGVRLFRDFMGTSNIFVLAALLHSESEFFVIVIFPLTLDWSNQVIKSLRLVGSVVPSELINSVGIKDAACSTNMVWQLALKLERMYSYCVFGHCASKVGLGLRDNCACPCSTSTI